MDQPSITPGSNGYQAMLPQQDFGANPWTPMDTSGQVQAGQQNLAGMQSNYSSYFSQSQPYPTFKNSANVGSGTALQSAPASSQAMPTYSSGFNPWSLTGEANTRSR